MNNYDIEKLMDKVQKCKIRFSKEIIFPPKKESDKLIKSPLAFQAKQSVAGK